MWKMRYLISIISQIIAICHNYDQKDRKSQWFQSSKYAAHLSWTKSFMWVSKQTQAYNHFSKE